MPGALVSIVAAVLLASPVARALRTRRIVAGTLIASLGIILAATLTPLNGTFVGAAVAPSCDLSRVGLAPIADLLRPTDASLNILLFIPFGLSIGLLPRGRPKALIILAAAALPAVIEITQLVAAPLARGCQSADVIDNLTGLVLGLAFGSVLGALVRWTGGTAEGAATEG